MAASEKLECIFNIVDVENFFSCLIKIVGFVDFHTFQQLQRFLTTSNVAIAKKPLALPTSKGNEGNPLK